MSFGSPRDILGALLAVGVGLDLWIMEIGRRKLKLGLFREIPFSVRLEPRGGHSSMGLDPKVLHGPAGWSRGG